MQEPLLVPPQSGHPTIRFTTMVFFPPVAESEMEMTIVVFNVRPFIDKGKSCDLDENSALPVSMTRSFAPKISLKPEKVEYDGPSVLVFLRLLSSSADPGILLQRKEIKNENTKKKKKKKKKRKQKEISRKCIVYTLKRYLF
jgi:hypothetical protein